LFDDRGNLIEVLSKHGTLDEAREAYATRLTKPRRADRVIYLCLRLRFCGAADRVDCW
jgi:hypothetical protein